MVRAAAGVLRFNFTRPTMQLQRAGEASHRSSDRSSRLLLYEGSRLLLCEGSWRFQGCVACQPQRPQSRGLFTRGRTRCLVFGQCLLTLLQPLFLFLENRFGSVTCPFSVGIQLVTPFRANPSAGRLPARGANAAIDVGCSTGPTPFRVVCSDPHPDGRRVLHHAAITDRARPEASVAERPVAPTNAARRCRAKNGGREGTSSSHPACPSKGEDKS
jgi:hypothetical protein